MKNNSHYLIHICSFLLMTCHISVGKSDTAKRFQAHMDFLASDLLEGRDTGSLGHEIASQYIATEFAKMGITPAGDDGSYMQRIEFKSALLDVESPSMVLEKNGKEHELKFLEDFMVGANINRTESSVTAELVFAGFGIHAPYLNYSDFSGIDLKGKIAVVLAGKPNDFPSEEGAHYSSMKTKALIKSGVIGVISLRTPLAEKIFPFNRAKNYIKKPRIRWVKEEGEVHNGYPEILGSAMLSIDASKQLMDLAGIDIEKIYQQIENNEQPKGKDLGISATISYNSSHSSVTSPNVIGILEGSDPELKNEYVLLSAHTDHIGVATHIDIGDKINNGAMDNAAGVSTLLEMAHQITQSDKRPRRSMLFAMVTAEEKGLLGSDYFANNPTVPIESIVANVNLDMPVLTNRFDQLIGFGAQHSSLWGVIEKAVETENMKLIPDPMPEQSIFVRSDQYSFVKKGVPAVFLVTADNEKMIFLDHEISSNDFIRDHYHQPSDQLDLPINYEVAAQFVAINKKIAEEVANDEQRPTWNKDSFFATITEK